MAVIALHAGDEDRKDFQGRDCPAGQCWLDADTLAHMSGLKADGVGKALRRLAARGLEARVPLVDGAMGRGAYSHMGSTPPYRIPKALVTGEGRPVSGPLAGEQGSESPNGLVTG